MTAFVICVGSSLLSKTTDVTDIYYFLKLSPPRREDYADVQQKLNLD